MTTYMTQWMFLGLITLLLGSFAVDFVGSALDASVISINANLEALK